MNIIVNKAYNKWLPGTHLEEEDTKGPPVRWFTVAFVQDHFRCHIYWGATYRPRSTFTECNLWGGILKGLPLNKNQTTIELACP